MKKTILISLLILGFSLIAEAQVTPRATARQQVQTGRIKEGVASGELTKSEAKKLARQQRSVRRARGRAKSDGVVTKRERRALKNMQNRTSRSIRREKNDDQNRN